MTQGIIIAKSGTNVDSSDPRNFTLDTREVGGLKIDSTHFIGPEDYTEIYNAPGPFPGSFYNYGRIRIPHHLGFSPAFKGYLVSYTDTTSYVQVLPVALGFGVVTISSNSTEVLVEKAPMPENDFRQGGPFYLTIIIFAENLDSAET